MARIVGIGGAILFLIVALGFADCIRKSPACTNDPCLTLWLHCTWATLNSTIVVALIAAGIAAGLAWWYQRANKVMELRFATFKDAMSVFRELSDAAWQHYILSSRIRLAQRRAPTGIKDEMLRQLERHADDLHRAITAAHVVIPINCVLFTPETQAHWGRLVTRMQQVARSDDLWERHDLLDSVADDRQAFVRAAACEMGLTYSEFEVEGVEAEREQLRAEVHQILQEIDPRPGRLPGGGNSEQQ